MHSLSLCLFAVRHYCAVCLDTLAAAKLHLLITLLGSREMFYFITLLAQQLKTVSYLVYNNGWKAIENFKGYLRSMMSLNSTTNKHVFNFKQTKDILCLQNC